MHSPSDWEKTTYSHGRHSRTTVIITRLPPDGAFITKLAFVRRGQHVIQVHMVHIALHTNGTARDRNDRVTGPNYGSHVSARESAYSNFTSYWVLTTAIYATISVAKGRCL